MKRYPSHTDVFQPRSAVQPLDKTRRSCEPRNSKTHISFLVVEVALSMRGIHEGRFLNMVGQIWPWSHLIKPLESQQAIH